MKSIVKTFNDYRRLKVGSKVDFDKHYGAQCVDLVKDWAMYIWNPIEVYGHANVLWTIGLGKNWKRVINTRFARPRVGDIIYYNIWKYGHIVVAWQNSIGWVEILEQNAVGTNSKLWRISGDGEKENAIRIKKDYYKNCVGWFTPN